MKFGGTSVGSADQIRRVGEIIQSWLEKSPIVVVSAVGGVTDRLLHLEDLAVDADKSSEAETFLEEIIQSHRDIIRDLEIESDLLDEVFDEFRDLGRGMALMRECTPKGKDRLVSFGERMSCRLVSAHLRKIGVASQACEAHRVGLTTDSRFGSARPLPDVEDRIRAGLGEIEGVPVITGFIGCNERGEITTLGRGGSDYSASLFGAAMGVEEIQIWTDVDGVLTADPRIVPDSRRLRKLSFAEASELAFYGAKVIHPATMIPAMTHGIPIRVFNTNRPEVEGTLVVAHLEPEEKGLKSVTSKAHVAVVTITAAPMLNQYGFMARISEVFSRYEVVIDMIATSEVSVSMTTDQRVDLEPVVHDLSAFSQVTVERDKTIISIVGEGMRDDQVFASRVFRILAEKKIPIEMISYGATRMNLSVLTSSEHARDAVCGLHADLFAKPN
jgi:aspartate kinase